MFQEVGREPSITKRKSKYQEEYDQSSSSLSGRDDGSNILHTPHSGKQSILIPLNGTHLSPPNILLFILCLCNNLLTDQRIKEYRDRETA